MKKPCKKKPGYEFPPEIQAIWHSAPNLTLCRKFRKAKADKVFAHLNQDRCERCLAVVRQLQNKMDLIIYLTTGRN
jgi:hypothetical protein